jgi:tetratricopeptide (TPR) repeat protein
MADRLITLEISDATAAEGPSFTYNLKLDDQSIAANKALSFTQAEQTRDIGETYDAVFANPQEQSSAQLAPAQLRAIGSALFGLWLEPHWQQLTVQPGDRQILVVASGNSEVLNLPWELLRPPAREDIGSDGGWGIRRLPWSDRKLAQGSDLSAGPLRVLFVACSPRNLAELDYEREEELLWRAVGSKALMETASLGTFDELSDRVASFRPHIVHLSGHGTIGNEGAAFSFENDKGCNDPRSGQTLGQRFAGSGVRCTFVSGCEAGSAPPRNALGGICQAIVAHGVPMAIGWGAAIVDDIATTIAERFYRLVATGRPVDYALAQARWEGKQAVGTRGDPSWSLPVLYASTVDTRVLDETLPLTARPRQSKEQQPLPGMTQGYAQYLVGRRRELQAVLPGLRDGTLRGVVITGMGGSGKSSLATRVARLLESGETSLTPIVVSCKPNVPLKPVDLLKAASVAFLQSNQPEASKRTKDPQYSIEERLGALVADISDGFVLVIDNFESTIDEATRQINDAEIAACYVNLLNNAIGTSRVIVTSRYLPADVEPLPDWITELNLGELSETAYLKFMFRDATVKRRFRSGAATRGLLDLSRRLGAAPSLAKRVRQVLTSVDPAELQLDIDQRGDIPGQDPPRPLSVLDKYHDDYCAEINVARLHGRLTADTKAILGRLSVFAAPIRALDAVAISGVSDAALKDALATLRKCSLIHGDWMSDDAQWAIYGTLRRWLAASPRLSAEDRQKAHRAAADYLITLCEQNATGPAQSRKLALLMQARGHYLAAGEVTEARKITYRLSELLIRRGDYAEVERLNQELLDGVGLAGADGGNFERHPDPATWIARAWLERSDYQKARQWYDQALTLAGEGYPVERAQAIQGLATIDIREGRRNASAREQLKHALTIQEAAEDRHGQAVTWHQLGSIDFNEGDYDNAQPKFETALALLEEVPKQNDIGDEAEQASWHQLGSIELMKGNLDKARTLLGKALTMARLTGNRKAEADAVHQLARVDAAKGPTPQALRQLREALEIRRSIGDRAGEALSFLRLGDLAGKMQKRELGLRLTMVCRVIHETIGGDTTSDLASVQRQADELGYSAEKLETVLAAVKLDYLGHGARTLLKQAYALV